MIALTVLYQTVVEKLTFSKCYPMALYPWSVPLPILLALLGVLFLLFFSLLISPCFSFFPCSEHPKGLDLGDGEWPPSKLKKNHTAIIFPAHLYKKEYQLRVQQYKTKRIVLCKFLTFGLQCRHLATTST